MALISDFKVPIGLLIDLSETESEQDVLDAFARWIRLIFDAQSAVVGLAAQKGFRTFCVENGDILLQGEILPYDDTVLTKAYRDRTSIVERDLANPPVARDVRRLVDRGMCGILVAPLVVADRCMGAMGAAFTDPQAFSDDDILTLEAVARSLASYLLLHEQLAQLNTQALTDSLTGCFNRRHYHTVADQAWQAWKDNRTPYSIAILDLDRFKAVNDTYGHDFGDDVLIATAETMRKIARTKDVPIRLGGEEFCLLMPDTDLATAEGIANALRSAVERNVFQIDGQEVRVTASIGLATTTDKTSCAGSLAKAADEALYLAKRNGRNQVWIAG